MKIHPCRRLPCLRASLRKTNESFHKVTSDTIVSRDVDMVCLLKLVNRTKTHEDSLQEGFCEISKKPKERQVLSWNSTNPNYKPSILNFFLVFTQLGTKDSKIVKSQENPEMQRPRGIEWDEISKKRFKDVYLGEKSKKRWWLLRSKKYLKSL